MKFSVDGLTADDFLLVPANGVLESRQDAQISPFIFSAPMDRVTGPALTKALLGLGEFPIVSRFLPDPLYKRCLKEFGTNPNAWFAVGACPQDIGKRLKWALEAHPSCVFNFVVDIAHGDSTLGLRALQILRASNCTRYRMSGSLCTGPAAVRSVDAGATHLRVGVGNGAVCTTRINTGIGVPQFTALRWVEESLRLESKRQGITIIADGGIRAPGDAVKYLAAGADAIMLGSAFSRAVESHGWEEHLIQPDWSKPQSFPVEPKYELRKTYRGQASAEFQTDQKGKANRCPEGASTEYFNWDGQTTAQTVVEKYRGGLASALSYLGLESSKDLAWGNVTFIRVSLASLAMSKPHGI